MTSDDQHFLDFLSSVPGHIKQWTLDPLADTLNHQVDVASNGLRHTLEGATWLPHSLRPRPPKPPPRLLPSPLSHPRGLIGTSWQWFVDNRIIVCPVAAFFGTGAFLYYRRKKLYDKKRRAKRTAKGDKTEVCVVAGNTHSPHTRSIILDLERRGFIVYVTTGTSGEEAAVREEGKQDILALHIDTNNPTDVENTTKNFDRLLRKPQFASSNKEAHYLIFAGVIIVPDISYPAGPVETISQELWSDAMQSKVLDTIATAHAFIRLLAEHRSRLIIATPSIISSIRPAFQSVESTIVGALDGFTDSLRSELAPLGVPVCQLRLGTFCCSSLASQQSLARNSEQEVLFWPPYARDAYAANYLKQERGRNGSNGVVHIFGRTSSGRGSPLRELNNAVFDALTTSHPRSVQRVGRGSTLYAAVGAVTPAAVVRWMMGIKPTQASNTPERRPSDSSSWETIA